MTTRAARVRSSDKAAVTRPWRSASPGTRVRCGFGGSALVTAGAYTETTWHHWACTFDAAAGLRTIYRDGVQVAQDTAGGYTGAGDLAIGRNFGGSLDEVTIHARALAAYEVANLYAYAQTPWQDAQVDGSADPTWTFALPAGVDGLEGFYQINVRGVDALGNVTPLSGQRVWRGEIDTKPPAVAFYHSVDDSGSIPTTTYRCVAEDTNLVLDTTCKPQVANPPADFRNGDIVQTTYAEVDPWYASAITDTARLYSVDGTRIYSGSLTSAVSVQTCDRYALHRHRGAACRGGRRCARSGPRAPWRRGVGAVIGHRAHVAGPGAPWRRRPRRCRAASALPQDQRQGELLQDVAGPQRHRHLLGLPLDAAGRGHLHAAAGAHRDSGRGAAAQCGGGRGTVGTGAGPRRARDGDAAGVPAPNHDRRPGDVLVLSALHRPRRPPPGNLHRHDDHALRGPHAAVGGVRPHVPQRGAGPGRAHRGVVGRCYRHGSVAPGGHPGGRRAVAAGRRGRRRPLALPPAPGRAARRHHRGRDGARRRRGRPHRGDVGPCLHRHGRAHAGHGDPLRPRRRREHAAHRPRRHGQRRG
ncbi:MAG: LamG domain-containing protein [Caldilineaceae bacterium]|nr:LamG domain-containing protein [Caldilineaceae bacterium]